jgi:hypothetical protein
MATKFVRLEIETHDDGNVCSLNCPLIYDDPEEGTNCPFVGSFPHMGKVKRPKECKEVEVP